MQDLTSKGYEVLEEIGTGGFGIVYRALQLSAFNREVAIKVIKPQFANVPGYIRRFEREAQIVSLLQHPHIVPLIDFWRDPAGANLVMGWLRGGNLKEMIARDPIDCEAAGNMLNQICAGLQAAHQSGVIHRDIKPSNVLLDEYGNAYVADFGIAKDLRIPSSDATEADMVVGSHRYFSPEQARSDTITPRTDVYSLGVMLYEMLAGEHPFEGVNPVDMIYKHLNDPLPTLGTLDGSVRESINEVIQTATAKVPAHRYATAVDFVTAYREAAQLGFTTAQNIVESLTWREQEILQLIVDGKSNKEIANELFIAVGTVRWHKRQIYKKLNVRSRVQAVVKARELHLIVSDGNGKSASQVDTTYFFVPGPENPYKGLNAFTAADSAHFFGRENLVKKLVTRMQEDVQYKRFMAVLGPSGSGKSSLVKAGLIPAIWRGKDLPGSDNWYVVEMLPGAYPLDELEVALTRVAADQGQNLIEHLERDARGLVRIGQLILPDDDSDLLVVIDQFEEIFTLVEDEARRSHFLDLIYMAATDPRSRVRVVVTLRADFYDRPLQYPQFGEMLRSRMETILPLSADELEAAIVKPARKVGVRFADGLVSTIVADVKYQPGALPLLQYALTELFDQREDRLITYEGYQAVGGTTGAIARRADSLFEELNEEDQEVARQIFLRLVTLGEGTEDTRRRVDRSELLAIAGDEDLANDIIDTYAGYRLLALDHNPASRAPTVEVAHEAILREWERLRGWLNESRDDIKMQRQLEYAAQQWQDGNRDAGHLLRGGPLQDFERWHETTQLTLTQLEIEFLQESLADREQRQAKEQAQAEREANLQARARRVLQGLVAVFVIATIIATGLFLFAMDREAEASDRATEARREAEVSHSVALASSAQEALFTDDTDLAIALALEAYAIDDPPIEARQVLAEAMYSPGTRRVLTGHEGPVSAVAFSPDGRYAASGGGRSWWQEENRALDRTKVDAEDYVVRLWDLETGQVVRFLEGHTDAVWDVAFSPDGTTLLSASSDQTLILWDVQTGAIIHRLVGHDRKVRKVVFSPDGATALSASADHSLYLWDLDSGEPIRRYLADRTDDDIMSLAISPDGQTALVGTRQGPSLYSHRGFIIMRDLETGDVIRRFGTTGGVFALAVSPDGQTALFGSNALIPNTFGLASGNVFIGHLDLETGQELQRMHTITFVTGVAFSPDGQTAISTTLAQTVQVWNLNTGENMLRLTGHDNWVIDMALSADGQQALTASEDGTARLWDLRHGAEVRRLIGHQSMVGSLDVSPDGRFAVSGSTARELIVWDVQTGAIVHRLRGHSSGIGAAKFSPDSRRIISSSRGNLHVWDVATGELINQFVSASPIGDLSWTPDGRFVFASESNFASSTSPTPSQLRLSLWDIEAGTVIREYYGHTLYVAGNDVSPNGRFGISTSNDSTIRLWDLASGEEIRVFRSNRGNVWNAAYHPDGKQALAVYDDKSLILWDLQSGEPLRIFEGHTVGPTDVYIGSAGQTAVSASRDGQVIQWDLETGQEVRRFVSYGDNLWSVVFTPDDNYALSGGRFGHITLWRLNDTDQEIIQWAQENRYIRDLTCLERERYNIEPYCGQNGTVPPARTPFPTLTASPLPSNTPAPGTIQPTQTLDWTPIPSYTPLPSATPVPIQAISCNKTATFFTPVRSTLRSGQADCWILDVTDPLEATFEVNATSLDGTTPVIVTIVSPSGEPITTSSEVSIGPVELSEIGSYEVRLEPSPGVTVTNYILTVRTD